MLFFFITCYDIGSMCVRISPSLTITAKIKEPVNFFRYVAICAFVVMVVKDGCPMVNFGISEDPSSLIWFFISKILAWRNFFWEIYVTGFTSLTNF